MNKFLKIGDYLYGGWAQGYTESTIDVTLSQTITNPFS